MGCIQRWFYTSEKHFRKSRFTAAAPTPDEKLNLKIGGTLHNRMKYGAKDYSR